MCAPVYMCAAIQLDNGYRTFINDVQCLIICLAFMEASGQQQQYLCVAVFSSNTFLNKVVLYIQHDMSCTVALG